MQEIINWCFIHCFSLFKGKILICINPTGEKNLLLFLTESVIWPSCVILRKTIWLHKNASRNIWIHEFGKQRCFKFEDTMLTDSGGRHFKFFFIREIYWLLRETGHLVRKYREDCRKIRESISSEELIKAPGDCALQNRTSSNHGLMKGVRSL